MNSDPTHRKVLVAVDASATLFGAPVATVALTPDDDGICWWDRGEMEAWAQRSRSLEIEPDTLNWIEFGSNRLAIGDVADLHMASNK